MRIIKSLKLEIYSDNIYKDIMAARVPRQLRLISLLRYLSHYYVTHHVTTLLVSLLRYSSRYYVTRLITTLLISLLRYSSRYCALSSYCLPATDRVICIKFRRSCFRLMLPLLNPKALHALHLSS